MRKRWKAAGVPEIPTEDPRVDFDRVQARPGIRGLGEGPHGTNSTQ
jgi:hypothetical protein